MDSIEEIAYVHTRMIKITCNTLFISAIVYLITSVQFLLAC